jgi:hypothetical protein
MMDVLAVLGDQAATIAAYRSLRTKVFVHEQGLFTGHDLDAPDEDPRTVVQLVTGSGVTLRRPDGEQTRVIETGATGSGTS